MLDIEVREPDKIKKNKIIESYCDIIFWIYSKLKLLAVCLISILIFTDSTRLYTIIVKAV